MEYIINAIANYDLLTGILLLIFGTAAFILSTVSGGGGSLLLVPALNSVIGVTNTAPILNLGTFIGRPARLIIFWKHINWKVFIYYTPLAIAGAWIASYFFSNIKIVWLQLFVAIFLISTVFQYNFGKKAKSFNVKLYHFGILGFLISLISTITGAVGPVLNPFYLNYGIDKEELIATKTMNSFVMGISQISAYTFFGLLENEYWIYGISLGIGATIGNLIGKKFLSRMKSKTFRILTITLMVISGVLMLINLFY